MDGPGEKPKAEAAAAPQVARVEVVHTGVPGAATPTVAAPGVPSRGGEAVASNLATTAPAATLSGGAPEASTPRPAPAPALPESRKYNLSRPSLPASPRVEYVDAEARGIGSTREDAIRRALREAASKGLGGSFAAEIGLQINSETRSINGDSSEGRTVQMQEMLRLRTGGLLAWWGISEEISRTGSWEVSISAVFAKIKPKSADPDAKWVVHVTPFRVASGFKVLADQMSPEDSRLLSTGAVNRQIVQSRKFGVVDREFEKEIEKLDLASAQGTLESAIRIAERTSTDFLISGEVTDLEITSFKRGVGRLPKPVAQGRLVYSVTDVASARTVFSRSVDLGEYSSLNLSGPRSAELLVEEIARQAAGDILEAIYPLRIAGVVDENEIALNRGGESIKPGLRLEVFATGKKIVDPSTNEVLGDAERRIGLVEITRVTPKMAFAKAVEKSEKFVEGYICRKETSK
jgi:hypothetical protein